LAFCRVAARHAAAGVSPWPLDWGAAGTKILRGRRPQRGSGGEGKVISWAGRTLPGTFCRPRCHIRVGNNSRNLLYFGPRSQRGFFMERVPGRGVLEPFSRAGVLLIRKQTPSTSFTVAPEPSGGQNFWGASQFCHPQSPASRAQPPFLPRDTSRPAQRALTPFVPGTRPWNLMHWDDGEDFSEREGGPENAMPFGKPPSQNPKGMGNVWV
jgi:hypothetical protein